MNEMASIDATMGCDILIVDDRITNRTLFSRLAAAISNEIRVHGFSEPIGALEWLQTHECDLVITDFRMPGLDGAEFIARLRQQASARDVPVVVVTAYADREARMRALEAGATDFLGSPVDPYEFQTRVRNLLRMGRQQRLLRDRAAVLATELVQSEASWRLAVRENREQLLQVIDTVPAMISAADREGRLVFVNHVQARIGGGEHAPGEHSPGAAGPPWLFGPEHHQRSLALNQQVFATGQALPDLEETIQDQAGEQRILLTTRTPLRDSAGAVVNVLTTSVDITERKRAEEDLALLARSDHLTKLPNRTVFHEQLQRLTAEGRRGDRGFALHFVDLDQFKLVNDGQGHQVGDQLLLAVADRLRQVVGGGSVVARLGGDEFGVLQLGSPSWREAAALADQVVRAMHAPFTLDETRVRTGASVGIAMYPRDGRTGADLLRNADLAMYRVKIAGRSGYQFAGDEEGERDGNRASLQADLRIALQRRQFVLHYQPRRNVRTGRVVGAEALLRWSRHGWGLLAPAAFLPCAEESGLILPISTFVLHEACRQARRWQVGTGEAVGVSVNLSPLQTRQPGLAQAIRDALEVTGLDPALLTVEVPEALVVERTALQDVRALGVRVCVDNYGTGTLSLADLRQNPVDCLKLDQTVVHALDGGEAAVAAVRGLVKVGQILAVEVSAIGVESPYQVRQLLNAGCEIMQGKLLGRPQQVETFAPLLTEAGAVPPSWLVDADS